MRNDFVIIVWIKVSSRVMARCWYKVLIKVNVKQARSVFVQKINKGFY